ncbi:MAG: recombinase family protein [Parvibaculales bacterium]
MRVVTYKRTSTDHQEVENQTSSLTHQIDAFGWSLVGEYSEVQSGIKSRDTRPQLRQLLQDARRRKFDRVMVYSLDRLGRSVVDVINTINELEEVGVHIFVVKNAIDTSTQQGKLFTYFCSIFGEMERDMLLSRQKESIKRLRDKNAKWGRGTLLDEEKKNSIISLREKGLSHRKIAETLEISKGSVQHALKVANG